MIRNLANDAQKWAEFRDRLRDQFGKAKDFAEKYGRRYNANMASQDLCGKINEFKSEINDRIERLDQTVRDLSQIVSIFDSFGQQFRSSFVSQTRPD